MRWCVAMVLAAGPAAAESAASWALLDGVGIAEALTDKTLIYEESSARQVFYASGRTLYESGRPSWGRWEVRGDKYCSQWPPADGWACYDFGRLDDGGFVFIGESGDQTFGRYEE